MARALGTSRLAEAWRSLESAARGRRPARRRCHRPVLRQPGGDGRLRPRRSACDRAAAHLRSAARPRSPRQISAATPRPSTRRDVRILAAIVQASPAVRFRPGAAVPRIEDYALIGDCETAALVSRRGSIDWLCFPRFDSGACFAALLGNQDHGRWLLAPAGTITSVRRWYHGPTVILETEFTTDTGVVSVIDFMPIRAGRADLVRIVAGRRGTVAMRMELVIRFDYGSMVPWVRKIRPRHRRHRRSRQRAGADAGAAARRETSGRWRTSTCRRANRFHSISPGFRRTKTGTTSWSPARRCSKPRRGGRSGRRSAPRTGRGGTR